ncbi:hypothetical protein ACROYT_G005062 [Oculina patagonica]
MHRKTRLTVISWAVLTGVIFAEEITAERVVLGRGKAYGNEDNEQNNLDVLHLDEVELRLALGNRLEMRFDVHRISLCRRLSESVGIPRLQGYLRAERNNVINGSIYSDDKAVNQQVNKCQAIILRKTLLTVISISCAVLTEGALGCGKTYGNEYNEQNNLGVLHLDELELRLALRNRLPILEMRFDVHRSRFNISNDEYTLRFH